MQNQSKKQEKVFQPEEETLVDIRQIHIDQGCSKEERIKQFLDQIKNPYLCRCGDLVIQSEYDENGPSLEERMKQYFRFQ